MELERLAGELRRATLNVVWAQWRTLGAGATARSAERSRHPRTLIDPEALVLVSLVLMGDERRLADLLHDWIAKNSDLLSVQRMKNLAGDYPDAVQGALAGRLAWLATVARDVGKDLRWRSAVQRWAELSEKLGGAGDASAIPEEPSEHLRAGAKAAHARPQRNARAVRASLKSRATRTRLTSDASLLLRLRLAFGVSVKADLLSFLLARTDEWATVRHIATATAYTPAAVRRAADDLAAARLIHALEGQPTSYRVSYSAWAPLLELEDRPPRWGSWHERFVFVIAFLYWTDAARERPLSRYALGANGRELLERHRLAFESDLIAVWSPHSPIKDWTTFLGRAVGSLAGWMEEMR